MFVLLAACGSQTSVSDAEEELSEPGVCQRLDTDVLRNVLRDMDPVRSLEEFAMSFPRVAIEGEVTGFSDGFSTEVFGDPVEDAYVLMEVAVSSILGEFGGAEPLEDTERLAITVNQGPVNRAGERVIGVRDFEAAIPAGTRIVAFVGPLREELALKAREVSIDAAVVAGATQGTFLDDCGRLVGAFDDGEVITREYPTLADLARAIRGLPRG